MKINKIYISAFGGLKDFTLELNDGLNVIYGNNEDGKSTVFAFIKAMFFGTGRNTKALSDSIRLKYTPWDGSTMAGRIFFEHENKKYCLEREFRKSDSTDRITLTDLDSGKESPASENIGVRFFGMSASVFERSLFIGNGDFIKDDTASSEINGKLSNIAITGTEDVSYKKIQKNIFDARAKIISKSGRTGSYNEDLQALSDLNIRLEKADDDAKTKSCLNNTATEKRAEYEIIYKKYCELKSTIEREQDFKNRQKLTEFLETKRQLDQLNNSLKLSDGTIINESYAQKIDFCINRYEKSVERSEQINSDILRIKEAIELQNASSPESTKEEIDKLTSEISRLDIQKTSLEQKESALNNSVEESKLKLTQAQNKKSAFNPLLLIISIIIAAFGGMTAYFVSGIVSVILCGVAAVLLTLSFIIRPKNTSAITYAQNELSTANTTLAETRSEKNLVQEQINNLNVHINTLSSVLHADAAVKAQRLADLAEKNDALSSEKEKIESIKTELLELLHGFDSFDSIENARTLLEGIKRKTDSQKELKLQLKTASQFLGNIDYDEAQAKLDAMTDVSAESINFEAVKTEFENIAEKLSNLKEELTIIATELKTSFKHSENPEELKRKITEIQEKLDAKKEFCDTADLALSVLEDSFYELRRGYGNELESLTHSIFADLTDGKYKNVSITDTLDISVEKNDIFGTREIGYLSLGTTHQAYLSLRLAITKLISNDTPLPVFLDDSLSQYDDTRTEKTIKFLNDFCANGQGILFTCHNSICDIAQKHEIEIKKPYN